MNAKEKEIDEKVSASYQAALEKDYERARELNLNPVPSKLLK